MKGLKSFGIMPSSLAVRALSAHGSSLRRDPARAILDLLFGSLVPGTFQNTHVRAGLRQDLLLLAISLHLTFGENSLLLVLGQHESRNSFSSQIRIISWNDFLAASTQPTCVTTLCLSQTSCAASHAYFLSAWTSVSLFFVSPV